VSGASSSSYNYYFSTNIFARSTGDIVIKPTWGKDQPNNYNGEQNCVVLDGGRNWLWNDVGCNLDYLHFICQHPPLSCGSPDILYNTTIVGKNFSVSAKIEYKCPKEHSLVGNAIRECQSNGVWSGMAPTCKCEYIKVEKYVLEIIKKARAFISIKPVRVEREISAFF
jgi:Sushi repeat (SCR repeat)